MRQKPLYLGGHDKKKTSIRLPCPLAHARQMTRLGSVLRQRNVSLEVTRTCFEQRRANQQHDCRVGSKQAAGIVANDTMRYGWGITLEPTGRTSGVGDATNRPAGGGDAAGDVSLLVSAVGVVDEDEATDMPALTVPLVFFRSPRTSRSV